MSLWLKVSHTRKLAGHIVCKFGGWARSPFLLTISLNYKSYTMVHGVAVSQVFLKVLLECQFRTESDTQKFHLRIDFEPLSIQF